MTQEDHLAPSQLGTKCYWDDLYTLETTNHASNPEDEGTVWFADSDAESRILAFLDSLSLPPATSFLDIGTGNGHLLFTLVEDGEFAPAHMTGIDYSEKSIELASTIAASRDCEGIVWKRVDVIRDDLQPLGEFDVVLDKGTFDAISLSETGKVDCEAYAEKIAETVKMDGGILLLTSCNWTEDELVGKMERGGVLEKCGRIAYRTFTFGGRKGQTICSVAFKRKI